MFLKVAPKKAPPKVSIRPRTRPPATAPPRLVTHCLAEFGRAEEYHECRGERRQTSDDHDVGWIEPQRPDRERRTRIGSVEGERVVLPVEANRGLDDEPDCKGGDHQREFRRRDDRPDEKPFDQDAECCGDQHGEEHDGRERQCQRCGQHEPDIGAERDHLALREVEHAARLERDHQGERDQRVNAADAEPRKRQLEGNLPSHRARPAPPATVRRAAAIGTD